jgi:GrpB-like predicted nucleotidyltransferase (UPF0157 family)
MGNQPVRIVDYDPEWPNQFDLEKKRLLGAIGFWLVRLEHIGSTSVPGLAAKPIIDILAGIPRLEDAIHCITPLRALGYVYVPDYEDELPERRYFRLSVHGVSRVHLHLVETGSDFWKRHLLFRDYLRSHLDVAEEYAVLKRKLAEAYGFDRCGYTDSKSDFINRITTLALAGSDG